MLGSQDNNFHRMTTLSSWDPNYRTNEYMYIALFGYIRKYKNRFNTSDSVGNDANDTQR